MNKGIVLGMVILVIGVGFQPAFANETLSTNENNPKDNDLIEATFKICKFNGIIKNTVLLTQQQSSELDNIIDNVKNDLEIAKDINEEEVYNNAIISFNNLGLLPNNMNSEEVQKEVSNNLYYKFGKKVKTSLNNNYKSDGFNNSFCWITGETDVYDYAFTTWICPAITIPLWNISSSLWEIFINFEPYMGPFLRVVLGTCLYILGMLPISLNDRTYRRNASVFGSAIGFGSYFKLTKDYIPTTGWIHTNGTNGEQSYEGAWYGQLFILKIHFASVSMYIGATGFTGIQIYRKDKPLYFMGYAKKVHIGTEPLYISERGIV